MKGFQTTDVERWVPNAIFYANMNQPLCSIALASKDGAKFISEQIESVLNQTYKNIELIICDDNSSDNTVDIIKYYQSKDNRIKLYQNKTSLGVVKNFEKAIMLCSGEYIALCDQDDIWHRDKIQKQINTAQNYKEPLLIHSDMSIIDKNGKTLKNSYIRYKRYNPSIGLPHILGANGVMGNTILINRELLQIILPFPSYINNHDYYIAVMAELFAKRVYMKDRLLKYRIHNHNSSNSRFKLLKKGCFDIKRWLQRDFCMPYYDGREIFLEYLLQRYNLSDSNKESINLLLDYIYLRKNRFEIYKNLLKNRVVRESPLSKTLLLIGILLHKGRV